MHSTIQSSLQHSAIFDVLQWTWHPMHLCILGFHDSRKSRPDGSPASNATVYLSVLGSLKPREIATTTDDGKYVFEGVGAGKYTLWTELNELTSLRLDNLFNGSQGKKAIVKASGYISQQVPLVAGKREKPGEVTVKLVKGQSIRGQLLASGRWRRSNC